MLERIFDKTWAGISVAFVGGGVSFQVRQSYGIWAYMGVALLSVALALTIARWGDLSNDKRTG